jgi:hypothetical protein
MSDSLLQFFRKNGSWFLSSSSPMSSSFLVCFEWFKIWWVHRLRFYKTSLYLGGKDATIKDFKLKILIHFNPLVTKHWTRYTKHLMSSPFIYQLFGVGTIRWRATNILSDSEVEEQCMRIWSSFNSWLFALSPIYPTQSPMLEIVWIQSYLYI